MNDYKMNAFTGIKQPIDQDAGIKRREITQRTSKGTVTRSDMVANEVPVAFIYNGNSHAVMMATPIDLNDFAVGFSMTERIIDSPSDIHSIEIRRAHHGMTIELDIAEHLIERLSSKNRQFSGRTGCGVCGISDLAAAIPNLDPIQKTALPEHHVIQKSMTIFAEQQVLQRQSGAVHAAALFSQEGSFIAAREDIGRHNALDKLIGGHIQSMTAQHFIVLSSRASHELVVKSVIAGVGTLVSISAATTLAIELAKKTNLNLIGFIRNDRQVIYSNPNN